MMVWLSIGHVTCRFLASTSIFPLRLAEVAYGNGVLAVVVGTRNILVPN